MYEEVCLLCGRPVSVDGRAYCSDECESLDATSPSISTTSSAYTSPYLHSNNGPGSLADVPALVPSAMGRALTAASSYKTHKNRHSISSSSASSAICSVFTDEDEEEGIHPDFAVGVEDDIGGSRELLGVDLVPKSGGSLGQYYRLRASGLSYARRPSGTNNRSTIPTLNRRTSFISSGFATGAASPRSTLSPEDVHEGESSDLPSVSPARSHHRRKPSEPFEEEREVDTTLIVKGRRNRASLPAYFSLLTVSTSHSSTRTFRDASSSQTLKTVARSFQTSPPTPRIANPVVDLITALSQDHSRPSPVEATPRGRGRQRDPTARSTSSRRAAARSPPRQSVRPGTPDSPPSCARRIVGPQSRARLDSIEKVADWVSNSPVVQTRGRPLTRRNSSPPAKPRFGALAANGDSDDDVEAIREVLARSLHFHRENPSEDRYVATAFGGRESRGRRRPDELDESPMGFVRWDAPGFGNGRSGLRARERERERGRPIAR